MKVKDASEIRRVENSRAPESKKTPEGDKVARQDKVSTEQKAQLDAAVSATQKAMGGSRAIRLEAIEAAVRQGTFKPDPQRIAQKILDDAELSAMLQSMLRKARE
jgi:negative regulator of flagellin synthesis FlgM